MENITQESGLSQGSVYNIFKDKSGFVWFSTQEGLNRFDGTKLKVYRNNPTDSNSIHGIQIWKIIEDAKGNLWIGTDLGLNFYDKGKDRFNFISNRDYANTEGIGLSPFYIFNNKEVWMQAYPTGLLSYNIETKQWKKIETTIPFLFDYSRTNCSKTIGETTWFLGQTGLIAFSHTLKTATAFNNAQNDLFTSFDIENDSTLWITSIHSLFKLNPLKNEWTLISTNQGKSKNYCIAQIGKEDILIGTDNGVAQLRIQKKTAQTVQHFTSANSLLKGNYISHIYVDYDHHVWINTDPVGISHFSFEKTIIESNYNYKSKPVNPQNMILCFGEDAKKNIYIGTSKGLIVVDSNFNQIQDIAQFANSAVVCVKYYNKKLLVGTDAGLFVVNPNQLEKCVCLIKNVSVECIYPTLNLGLLVRTNKAIYAIAENLSKFEVLKHFSHAVNTIKDLNEHQVILSKTNGGFDIVDCENKKAGQTKSISSNYVINDFIIHKDTLYCASNSGLLRYSLFDNSFEELRHQNLENVKLYNILEVKQNQFWLNSNNGIFMYSATEHTARKFGTSNGLLSMEYNQNGFFVSSKNTLVCAGVQGIDRFNTDSILIGRSAPSPYWYAIRINEKPYKADKDLQLVKSLSLHHNENTLAFDLGIIDYCSKGNNQIAYKLNGYENDWVYSKTNHTIRYANLPPGEYKLLVKASNADQIWSKEAVALSIHIKPPYYQTWWFYLLCCLLTSLLLYGLYRYRLAQQLKAYTMRQNIANDLHDDIGSTLASISFTSQYLKKQLQTKDQNLSDIVGGMYENSRAAMENLSDIVWSINPMNDQFRFIINKFKSIGNTIEQTTDIQFELNVDDACNKLELNMQARKNIYLVVKEIINNTLKHAQAKQIHIQFEVHHQKLLIAINDDGIGFEPNHNFVGNGLMSIQARIKELGGGITLITNNNEGVKYSITFPLSRITI